MRESNESHQSAKAATPSRRQRAFRPPPLTLSTSEPSARTSLRAGQLPPMSHVVPQTPMTKMVMEEAGIVPQPPMTKMLMEMDKPGEYLAVKK